MKPNIHKLNGFIYVTSEDEIIINDYYLAGKDLHKCISSKELEDLSLDDFCKKIILTNNKTLTNVQQLTPEEEAYCNTVDSVEVKYTVDFNSKAVIVIPKQETDYTALLKPIGTKQETIEAMADEYSSQALWKCDESWKDGYNHAVKTLYTADDMLGFAEYLRNKFIPSGENWKQGTFEYEETELLEMYDRHFKDKFNQNKKK